MSHIFPCVPPEIASFRYPMVIILEQILGQTHVWSGHTTCYGLQIARALGQALIPVVRQCGHAFLKGGMRKNWFMFSLKLNVNITISRVANHERTETFAPWSPRNTALKPSCGLSAATPKTEIPASERVRCQPQWEQLTLLLDMLLVLRCIEIHHSNIVLIMIPDNK